METLEQVKSLKGGEFIIKESTTAQVFTPEDYTEEQLMVRSMTSDFVEKEVMTKWKEYEKQEPGLSKELLAKAGELGLLSTAIPETYGGMNQDVITGCIIAEEYGRTGSFATTSICHIGIGTLPTLYFEMRHRKKNIYPN